jgi:phosphate transport system protein
MDNLHRQLFTVLMDHDRWKHGVPAAVDVALLGRFYERFADHAVEVGRRVVFQVTGTLPAEDEISTYLTTLNDDTDVNRWRTQN